MANARFFRIWGFLACLCALFALLATPAQAEDSVRLRPAAQPDALRRVGISLEVSGHLLVHAEGKDTRLPMEVDALVRHQERLVPPVGEPGSAAPLRSVRFYDEVKADLKIEDQQLHPKLSEDRRLMVASLADSRVVLRRPAGALTREELDLVELPGDSLMIDRLLPDDNQPRTLNATWKQSEETMALLFGLDAVGHADVESKLYELTDKLAKIEMTGTVHGAIDGIATKIELKCRYYFHRQRRQINGLELHWQEEREVGHVSPGVDVAARLKMHLAPLDSSEPLAVDQLQSLDLDEDEGLALLEFVTADRRVRFLHDRRWHVTGEVGQRLAMRLVDDGELIAQCNVLDLKPLKEGERISLEDFQADVKRVLGAKFGQFVRAKQSMDEADRVVYRVEVAGRVAELPIRWIYYLVSARDGRRVSLVFTMEESLLESFAMADQVIVSSLEMLTGRETQAAAEATSDAPRR